jgi:hypothetical protein
VFPVLVGGVGYFFTRRLYMDLMDEVLDGGDFLLVRNDGKEERVALSNIANVSASLGSNMVRITLRLLVPSRLGSEIVFMPPLRTSFLSLTKSPVAEDLIARVQAARSRRGS